MTLLSNDRLLLEKAAKAAGYAWTTLVGWRPDLPRDDASHWNPLTDDGDALRLAIRLQICIEFGHCTDDAPVVRCGPEWERENWPQWPNFPDPGKATRYAIVKAAADMADIDSRIAAALEDGK